MMVGTVQRFLCPRGLARKLLAGLAVISGVSGWAVLELASSPPAGAAAPSGSVALGGAQASQVSAAPSTKVHQVPVWNASLKSSAAASSPGATVSVTDSPGHVFYVNTVTGAPTTRYPATTSWAPYADLVYASVQDSGVTVTVTAKTAESNTNPTYSPFTDSNWIQNDTYIGWQFRATTSSSPSLYEVYFAVGSTGRPEGVLFHTGDDVSSEVSCSIQLSYSHATGYVAKVPAVCLHDVTTFTWDAFSHYDSHADDPDGRLAIGKVLPDFFDNGGVRYAPTVTAGSAAASFNGYWLAASDGGVFSFGAASFKGSMGGIRLNQPVVGGAATLDGGGYWLVASDGGIFSFGDALFYGSMGGMHLNQPIVGMAVDPAGDGYWLVAADGGIFSFGGAKFYGSTGGMHLNQRIVGMAADPSGSGYWLVAADGGVFTFGGAHFYGSSASMRLDHAVVGIAADSAGTGYWLATSSGRVYNFGSAASDGSTAGTRLNGPIVGIAAAFNGAGYLLVASDGGIFTFGGAGYDGSMGNRHLNRPIVGMAVPS